MGTTFTRRRLQQRVIEILAGDRLPPAEGVAVGEGIEALAAYPPARLAIVDVEDLAAAAAGGDWRVIAVDLDQLSRDPGGVVQRVRAALNRSGRERHPTARPTSPS